MESTYHFVRPRPPTLIRTEYHLQPWVAFIILLTLFVAYCVYQVYFSPLARYPGPLLAKLTIFRNGYHAWKGDIHLDQWMCHLKYGPVVRYGPNFVSFDTSTGLKEIYSVGSNTWKHRHFEALSPRAQNLVTLRDKKVHAKRRRIIGRSFSDANIKMFEDRILHHINTFCEKVDSLPQKDDAWKPAIKVSDWCSYLVFDIITEFVFGSSYHMLESNKYRHILHDIEDASTRNAVLIYLPFLALGGLHRRIFPEAVKGTRGFWNLIKAAIGNYSETMNSKCVLSNLIQPTHAPFEPHLEPQVIQSESGGLVLAGKITFSVTVQIPFFSNNTNVNYLGLDTTVTAISSIFFYLARNPYAYEKLASEIRNTFSSAEEIRLGATLYKCKYLNACIDECLRITPPIGTSPWREVGKGGISVDGNFVPEGTSVGTCIYSIHHNEKYFPRPHEFIPERWIANEQDSYKTAQVATARAAFNPFSTGPRGCIGRPLVNSNLLLTVAILIWRYDFRVPDGVLGKMGAGHPLGGNGRTNPMEFQVLDRIMSVIDGPMIQFRRRFY
ncbi:hypothetical protein McanMca71_001786 [Microsporum canis]